MTESPPSRETARSWVGNRVHDSSGDEIGSLAGALADDPSGLVEWLDVELADGAHAVVPVDGASETAGVVRVGFTRAVVVAAPSMGSLDRLSEADELRLYDHYGATPPSGVELPPEDTATADAGTADASTADAGTAGTAAAGTAGTGTTGGDGGSLSSTTPATTSGSTAGSTSGSTAGSTAGSTSGSTAGSASGPTAGSASGSAPAASTAPTVPASPPAQPAPASASGRERSALVPALTAATAAGTGVVVLATLLGRLLRLVRPAGARTTRGTARRGTARRSTATRSTAARRATADRRSSGVRRPSVAARPSAGQLAVLGKGVASAGRLVSRQGPAKRSPRRSTAKAAPVVASTAKAVAAARARAAAAAKAAKAGAGATAAAGTKVGAKVGATTTSRLSTAGARAAKAGAQVSRRAQGVGQRASRTGTASREGARRATGAVSEPVFSVAGWAVALERLSAAAAARFGTGAVSAVTQPVVRTARFVAGAGSTLVNVATGTAAVGTGYVLGARAGRQRFEQLRQGATSVVERPAVQRVVEKVPVVGTSLTGSRGARGAGGTGSTTSTTPTPSATPTTPVQPPPVTDLR